MSKKIEIDPAVAFGPSEPSISKLDEIFFDHRHTSKNELKRKTRAFIRELIGYGSVDTDTSGFTTEELLKNIGRNELTLELHEKVEEL